MLCMEHTRLSCTRTRHRFNQRPDRNQNDLSLFLIIIISHKSLNNLLNSHIERQVLTVTSERAGLKFCERISQ
ncbi:hypothetical protein ABKN59_005218 [Abortiporus biennis]